MLPHSASPKASTQLLGPVFLFTIATAAAMDVNNFDIWWHLAVGRFIVQGGGIPQTDPLSFTAGNIPWVDHEWLFQVLAYGLHTLGGVPALVLLRVLCITATAALVLRFTLRHSRADPAWMALLLVPCLLAGRGRFVVRPELFTLLFSTLLLTALLDFRDRPPSLRRLLWIPPLFALWSNLHGGMILGLALFALFVGGRTLESFLHLPPGPGHRPPLVPLWLTLGASALAGCLNPYGWKIYGVPFHLGPIVESGLYRNSEWLPPSLPWSWLYFVVLAGTLLFLILHRRHVDLPALLPLLFLVFLSLRYIRNVALFSILAPVLVVCFAARSLEEPSDSPERSPLSSLVLAVLLLLASSFVLSSPFGFGIAERFIPVHATDFLAEHRPEGRLFNTIPVGGYAAWRLGPEQQIFVDGRNEVFADLWRTYREAEQDQNLWTRFLDEYGIQFALIDFGQPDQRLTVPNPQGGPPRTEMRPYATLHFPRRHWALVAWDDAALVYLRRSPALDNLIGEYEFRCLLPEDPARQHRILASGRVPLDRCWQELERVMETNPESWRAQELLDLFATSGGR